MYKVKLNHASNPDIDGGYWREAPPKGGHYVEVSSLAEASKAVRDYIEKYELGLGNFTGGEVRNSLDKPVALISYGGGAWDIDRDDINWPGKFSELDFSKLKEIKFNEPALNIEDLQFTHEDMDIINPLLSECGRFTVTPDNYGFIKQDDRDDGATVWYRPIEDNQNNCELVLVDADKSPFLATLSIQDAFGNVFAKATIEQLNERAEALLSGDPLAYEHNKNPDLIQ